MAEKEIKAPADIGELQRVISFVDKELYAHGCPDKERIQVEVAVEEIFVNIAKYAYTPNKGYIDVALTVGGNPLEVAVRFTDSGAAFNPLKKEDPDVTLAAGEREIGGLGVYMVKKSMDHVEYRCEGGKNILTIRKKIAANSGKSKPQEQ